MKKLNARRFDDDFVVCFSEGQDDQERCDGYEPHYGWCRHCLESEDNAAACNHPDRLTRSREVR